MVFNALLPSPVASTSPLPTNGHSPTDQSPSLPITANGDGRLREVSSSSTGDFMPGSIDYVHHSVDIFPLPSAHRITSQQSTRHEDAVQLSAKKAAPVVFTAATTSKENSSPACSNISHPSTASSTNGAASNSKTRATSNSKPPFVQLPGEGVKKYDTQSSGGCVYMTNYRLFVLLGGTEAGFHNVPLATIDTVETQNDLLHIVVKCKDGSVFRLPTENSTACIMWYKELIVVTTQNRAADEGDIFAYRFHAWLRDTPSFLQKLNLITPSLTESSPTLSEYHRLKFDPAEWRLSEANSKFELCASYPRHLIVPTSINDDRLTDSAKFRLLNRLPVAVWRCQTNGAVLLRSAQPGSGLGFFGYRSDADECILQTAIECVVGGLLPGNASKSSLSSMGKSIDATVTQQGRSKDVQLTNGHKASNGAAAETGAAVKCGPNVGKATPVGHRMLIMDARSWSAAWANRYKGGGYENSEHYNNCDVQFMGMANIHNIRGSFTQLRDLLAKNSNDYLNSLHTCQWFSYLCALLSSASRVVSTMTEENRSVLVHCSDGWDRTSQIVSLAKLLSDPHYRTIQGFRDLIDMDWVQFGHKFADRSGIVNGDANERAPVFLQWLDAVHQLLEQNPLAFEFNRTMLVKIAQHTYSSLFGTFLCNSMQEIERRKVSSRTMSLWSLLHSGNDCVRNLLYERCDGVLWPRYNVQDIRLWRAVYCDGSTPTGASHLASVQATTQPTILQSTPKLSVGSGMVDLERGGVQRTHSCDSLPSAIGSQIDVNEIGSPIQPTMTNLMSTSLHKTSSCCNLPSAMHVELSPGSQRIGDLLMHACAPTNASHSGDALTANDAATADVLETVVTAVSRSRTNTMPSRTSPRPTTPAAEIPRMAPITLPTRQIEELSVNDGTDEVDAATTNGRCKHNGVEVGQSAVDMRTPQPPTDGDMMFALTDDDADDVPLTMFMGPKKITDMITSTSEISDSALRNTPRMPQNTRLPMPAAVQMRRSESTCSLRTSTISQLIDADGLVKRHVDVEQDKLRQMKRDYQRAFDALEVELQARRTQCQQQRRVIACTKCRENNAQHDDEVEPMSFTSAKSLQMHQQNWNSRDPNAQHGGRRHDSCAASDLSWEAVQDEDALGPTKWVPDHAATHCMGCDKRFWGYNRKHHCRSCGKVFCSACSDFECAVPDEQLFHAVRVCERCHDRITAIPDGRDNPSTTPAQSSSPTVQQNGGQSSGAETNGQPRLKAS